MADNLQTYKLESTVLHVENVSVVYDRKEIISQINFEEKDIIREGTTQGQTIAVVGRSGRGKSTLFRVLTGLEKPATGRVLIPDYKKSIVDGKQPAKEVAEGDVGFVNQKYTLFRHKTIYQTLQFAMRNSSKSETQKKEEIMHYLSSWGLEKNKDQYPNELSGGQKQRTAILEQMLCSGYYMVLDEPFSGLDVGNIQNVKEAFELINTSNEFNTIIFSTHDIELAVELADSIYIIGYSTNELGNLINTGTILQHFDLKALGLAWHKNLTPQHLELVNDIKNLLLKS